MAALASAFSGLAVAAATGAAANRHTRLGFRFGGVGTHLLTHHAVLLGQIAVGIAGKVRQERRHFGLWLAIFHAQRVVGVGLFHAPKLIARPHGVLRGHAVAVGHAGLHLGDVFV